MRTDFQIAKDWVSRPQMIDEIEAATTEALQALNVYSTQEMRHNVLSQIFQNIAESVYRQAYCLGREDSRISARGQLQRDDYHV